MGSDEGLHVRGPGQAGEGVVAELLGRLDAVRTVAARGQVLSAVGLVLRAELPGAAIGELASIQVAAGKSLSAEVVGFEGREVLLTPLGSTDGVRAGSPVQLETTRQTVAVSEAMLGRVLGGLGRPIDGRGPLPAGVAWPVARPAPPALSRRPVSRPVETGVRVLDGLLTLGHGQRVGIFAGAGAGKSQLLARLAASSEFDAVVLALVGERGREVRSFLDDALGDRQERVVCVVATSDEPPQVRLSCARVATAIAEFLRDRCGRRTLLCIDSLTRVARAHREVALAAGEPPVRQGYPPSLAGLLAGLVERAGNSASGELTAVYTVLTEAGRMDDPVADEVAGLLDGHVVLSPSLAARGHFPAVDVLQSRSRLMERVVSARHREAARRLRQLLAAYESRRDLIELGAYRKGASPEVDEALDIWPEVARFLTQGNERTAFAETVEALGELADV